MNVNHANLLNAAPCREVNDSSCNGFCRSLYNTIIIVRILLTWFPNPPQVIAGPLRC